MPSCSPFSSMTRISRARILSLMRIKDFAERLSSAMGLLQMSSPTASGDFPNHCSHSNAPQVYHLPGAAQKRDHSETSATMDKNEPCPRGNYRPRTSPMAIPALGTAAR